MEETRIKDLMQQAKENDKKEVLYCLCSYLMVKRFLEKVDSESTLYQLAFYIEAATKRAYECILNDEWDRIFKEEE
jgi:hypothetical protein